MFLENTINRSESRGWIEVVSGSMFSGKTEELIRRMKRAQIAQQPIKIFKPKIDNRYSKEKVVSHNSNSINSIAVSSSAEILAQCHNIEVVGIDEVQFFDDGIIDVCNTLANNGVRVIAAGLDMDFQAKPFGPMPPLMAIAEYVTKVHAICIKCGHLAHYSHRTQADEQQILVGEKDSYEPLCRTCYNEAVGQQKKNELVNQAPL